MSPKKEIDQKKSCDMSVEEGLIQSLTTLRDSLKNGESLHKRFTMRTVDLNLEPQEYGPEQVRATRESLGASQAVFAKLLGVTAKTVQSWEQGLVPPSMARRLLDIINDDKAPWLEILHNAAKYKAD